MAPRAIGADPTSFNEIDAVGPGVDLGVGNFPGFVDLNRIFIPVQPSRTHQCPSNFRCHSHLGHLYQKT